MNKANDLLLDVLFQAAAVSNDLIDDQCIRAYEDACDYLEAKGYLKKSKGRLFKVVRWE